MPPLLLDRISDYQGKWEKEEKDMDWCRHTWPRVDSSINCHVFDTPGNSYKILLRLTAVNYFGLQSYISSSAPHFSFWYFEMLFFTIPCSTNLLPLNYLHLFQQLIKPENDNLLEDLEWHILPVFNVDGYNYTFSKVRSTWKRLALS